LLPLLIIQLPFLSLHPNFHFTKFHYSMAFYLWLFYALINVQDHAFCSSFDFLSMSSHQINYSTTDVVSLSLQVFSCAISSNHQSCYFK
jgi:hypothetical protein